MGSKKHPNGVGVECPACNPAAMLIGAKKRVEIGLADVV